MAKGCGWLAGWRYWGRRRSVFFCHKFIYYHFQFKTKYWHSVVYNSIVYTLNILRGQRLEANILQEAQVHSLLNTETNPCNLLITFFTLTSEYIKYSINNSMRLSILLTTKVRYLVYIWLKLIKINLQCTQMYQI